MQEVADNRIFGAVFSRYAHHDGFSVFHVMQNLYVQGKQMLSIGRNISHMILFAMTRDGRLLRNLATEIFPGKTFLLLEAYEMATRERFGYLCVDLRPYCPTPLRLRTGLLPVGGRRRI